MVILKMIAYKPDSNINPDKIIKIKRKIAIISNKHKAQIIKEITDYARRIKLGLDLNITINIKVVGNERK